MNLLLFLFVFVIIIIIIIIISISIIIIIIIIIIVIIIILLLLLLIDMQSSLEMSKAGEEGCADPDTCAGVMFANFKTVSQEQVSELIKKAAKK